MVNYMILLDICSNPDVLSVARIIRIVLLIIRIIGPIALILSLMLTYLRAVKDNDNDALNKANRSLVPKIVSAILLFLVPTFVNLIANIVDYNSETYLSCLKYATLENIDGANIIRAESAIDQAKLSLSESDYNLAISYINKVKNATVKAELLEEIKDVKSYIEIRKEIAALKNNFDRKKYEALLEKIENINDVLIKEKLKKELKDSIGAYGSLAMYDINPSSSLYKNTRPLQNITIKELLAKNGSSVDKLNLEIRNAVEAVGVGTREAPVAAAMVLHETLARYGYHLYYRWGGKLYGLGVDPGWGKNIGAPGICSTHFNPSFCFSSFKYGGLDCSGFVNWAISQGFQDKNHPRQSTTLKNTISIRGQNKAICNVGDTLVNDVHITLIAALDDKNKRYIILEDTGSYGMRLSTVPYNTSAYFCRKVDYKN